MDGETGAAEAIRPAAARLVAEGEADGCVGAARLGEGSAHGVADVLIESDGQEAVSAKAVDSRAPGIEANVESLLTEVVPPDWVKFPLPE